MGIDPANKTMAWLTLRLERSEPPQNDDVLSQPIPPQNVQCECHQMTATTFPGPSGMMIDPNNLLRCSLSIGELEALNPHLGENLVVEISRPKQEE